MLLDEQKFTLKLLDSAVRQIKANQKAHPQLQADVLDAAGNVYRSLGRHLDAEPLLLQAQELRRVAGRLRKPG